jgi:adenylosuccinate lyase
MTDVWSEDGKLARWLEVELAAVDAWAELGVVPARDAEELRACAVAPSAERVAELELTTHHDVAAFVDAVTAPLGNVGRWFHYGLTSSDVTDTALSLQICSAGTIVVDALRTALAAVTERAEEHRGTLMIGRTHGVHAEPITFGLKLAGWAFELARAQERLAAALDRARVGKLSGAVGTYATSPPELERLVCDRLRLEPAYGSTQVVARDRHADVLCALALAAGALERFAVEIRHLARTEVGEVAEPFRAGQKGSSAMPHKRNPVVAEQICGLARVVRAAALIALENMPLWHERDISHSSAERVAIPDAFFALHTMLDRFAWLVRHLVVRSDRMRENLDSARGVFFSQRLLLALVETGSTRDEAYRLVQELAAQALDEQRDLRALARADARVRSRLTATTLAEIFELEAYTAHVDAVFERLAALTETEAVHA